MPYDINSDLPDSVKNNLPAHAQTIYRKAFNSAWQDYAKPEDRRGGDDREKVSHKVAWAAVKNEYHKEEGEWVKDET
jgi:cation transport regulator